MKIGIYGGYFNPPHIGHVTGAWRAVEQLALDKLLVIPSGVPPHKNVPQDTPSAEHRLNMAKLAFRHVPNAEVSDIEILRPGESYTSDTVREIIQDYQGAEFFLITGTDMYLTLGKWYESDWLLNNVTPAVTMRFDESDDIIKNTVDSFNQRGIDTKIVRNGAIEISSSELRRALSRRNGAEYLDDCVYWYIIENKLYGAKPEFDRLRRKAYTMLDEKRIRHVAGCEEEAVHLARRWNINEDEAREAAILHDITKNLCLDEQLEICRRYGVETDEMERVYESLLHSKTAAAIAKCKFNVNNDVAGAILWHTTGRAGMTMLEKIIYMSDYIEPNRNLEFVDMLRQLAYEDIDRALIIGMKVCIDDLTAKGKQLHPTTKSALDYLTERVTE